MRDQLEDRLRLLFGGPLDLPMRQRAISDTMAWSHDLLSAPEQMLFAQLAAFAGGRSLAAIEAVCAGDGRGALGGTDLLGGLESLGGSSPPRLAVRAGGGVP